MVVPVPSLNLYHRCRPESEALILNWPVWSAISDAVRAVFQTRKSLTWPFSQRWFSQPPMEAVL